MDETKEGKITGDKKSIMNGIFESQGITPPTYDGVAINHFFGNSVASARLDHLRNKIDPKELDRLKKKFLTGIGDKRFSPEIQTRIDEMLKIARGDWGDIETIKNLYRKRAEVLGEEYGEEEERDLFKGK